MEEYSFHEGSAPSGFTYTFEVSLFNQEAHRLLQSPDGWISFYIVCLEEKKIHAAIHFNTKNDLAASPLRSPFGSIEFSVSLPDTVLFDFIKFFTKKLGERNVSRIVIKNYLQAYAEHQSKLLQSSLVDSDYKIVVTETGSVIDINRSSVKDFFHRSAQRRLNKAQLAGLIFRELEITDLAKVYEFILACRNEKQYPISMSFADLKLATNLYPDKYILFGVFDRDDLVAASITIRVKEKILYDFYHDHTSSYDHLSPVVLLVAGIYEFCQRNKFELLDLGTSAIDGADNLPLIRFKNNLGGRPTTKFTFEKKITDD